MTYLEWFDDFAQKHETIVKKLLKKGLNEEQIIDYFDFESMLKNEPDFCPLYAEGKKCHEIESLNCYLCACPYFRFNDKGFEIIDTKTKYSYCSIDAKDGRLGTYGDTIHQDCTKCTVPHHRSYIKKSFDYDWKKIMSKCNLN